MFVEPPRIMADRVVAITDWMIAVGTDVAAVVAVTAVVVAVRQINENRNLNAQDAYLQFNRLGIDYPILAAADSRAISKDERLNESYKWYVVTMLMCIERILILYPKDKAWRLAVKDDIETHEEYIFSEFFSQFMHNFDPVTQRFLQECRLEYEARA